MCGTMLVWVNQGFLEGPSQSDCFDESDMAASTCVTFSVGSGGLFLDVRSAAA